MSGKDDSPVAVGKLRLNVAKLTELTTPVKSPIVYIANIPWSLVVESECSKRTSNIKQLSVYVHCNEANKSPHWSCDATVIYNLLSPKVGQKSFSRKTNVNTYNANQSSWGYHSFMAWDKVLDPENGFIREEDSGVVVEAEITVKKVMGLLVPTRCDFTAPQPNLTDVALIVEEKPLHVCKAYLRVPLACLQHDVLLGFCREGKEGDSTSGRQVRRVRGTSSRHLPVSKTGCSCHGRGSSSLGLSLQHADGAVFVRGVPARRGRPGDSAAKKLLWSDQYRLASLQYICLEKIKAVDELRVLKRTKEYGDFSRTMIDALFERTLELI